MRCNSNICILHWVHGCNSCQASLQPRRNNLQFSLNQMIDSAMLNSQKMKMASKSLSLPQAPARKHNSTTSVYMRELPEHTISFSSPMGKILFKQALMAGTMENYFKLAEQFTTQADPAYCGPASLIMVLNSL